MGQCRRLKTLLEDASRDLLSELPIEVKDRILECLPTRDAARTALLSRHWNHVWLQHGRLALDHKFWESVQQRQDDQRTIKQLIVQGPFIDLPVNACDIFSNVTSLEFLHVEFKRGVNGIASSISIPKLEKLAFNFCSGINKFDISPPKLEILSIIHSMNDVVDSRWLPPHLKTIKTLWLSGSSLEYMDASMFPTAINLQVMKLYGLNFWCRKQLVVAMQLLKKCSNLCELHILMAEFGYDKEAASRLLEDPDSCFVIHELKMLKTIKIKSNCSTLQMLFIRMLLSKSPLLERFIVKFWGMNAAEVRKIQRKLECFPRASSNAHIVFIDNDNDSIGIGWPVTLV